MSVHRRNLSLIISFGILAVCYLPVLAPVARASGFSYVFHYNNRVGSLLLLALLVVVAFYVRRNHLQLPAAQRISPPSSSPSLVLPFALAITLFAALGLWWLAAPWGAFYESGYFIDRLQLLLAGRHIYTQFEFIYGPLLLYIPAWFCHLFALSAAGGYYAFWTFTLLAGTVMLWQIVQGFELDGITIAASTRARIFILLWCYQLLQVATTGLNYSVFRVVLPFAVLLWLYRTVNQGHRARAFFIAVLGLALLLATSPEQGFAFSFATLFYLPLLRWARRTPLLGAWLLLLPLFAIEFFIASRAGVFITLRTFSIGGGCFPIYLNPYTLAIFAALLLSAAYLGSASLRQRLLPSSAPMLLYAYAVLPAAFGRCEPLHLMDNGIIEVLSALLLLYQWPRAWRRTVILYVILFVAYPLATMQERPLFGRVILAHLWANGGPHGSVARRIDHSLTWVAVHYYGPEGGRSRLALLHAASGVNAAAGQGVLAGATSVVEAPFSFMPNTIGPYQGPLVDTGYFSGTFDVFTPGQVQRKIAELAAHPDRDVIIRWEAPKLCLEDIPDSRVSLRQLSMTPVLLPAVHSDDIVQPLCSYIQTHYQMVRPSSPEASGYSLWRPNAQ